MSFTKRLRSALDRLYPLWRQTVGIVGVSGGADSVGLLCGLRELQAEIIVAHLNHQLRGTESDLDEAFVVELAAKLGCRVVVHRVQLAQQAGNLEANARTARYEFFSSLAKTERASWVATAHTAGDQAETVLHRLIRGCGLTGLRGIAEQRELGPAALLRPILGATRTDVLVHLQARGQEFRTDASNANLVYTRNRIRAELLPQLLTFNPNIVERLCQLSLQAAEWEAEQDAEAERILPTLELPRAGSMVVLNARPLAAHSLGKLRVVLRFIWRRERWPLAAMKAEHWQAAAQMALGQLAIGDFPAGMRLRRTPYVVQLFREPSLLAGSEELGDASL